MNNHQGLNWSIYSYITSLIASGLLIGYIYSKLLLVYKKNGRNNSSQAANSLETIGFCQSSPRELLNGQFLVARRRHYQTPLLTLSFQLLFSNPLLTTVRGRTFNKIDLQLLQ